MSQTARNTATSERAVSSRTYGFIIRFPLSFTTASRGKLIDGWFCVLALVAKKAHNNMHQLAE
jgi:hypothetical protein